jgi:hypothetical protein
LNEKDIDCTDCVVAEKTAAMKSNTRALTLSFGRECTWQKPVTTDCVKEGADRAHSMLLPASNLGQFGLSLTAEGLTKYEQTFTTKETS